VNSLPDRESGWTAIPLRASPLIAIAAVIALVVLLPRHQALKARNSQLERAIAQSESRERDLEAAIARQHQDLLRVEGELDTLRFQMDSIELQLDGVDYLSNQVRAELGLPPSYGTWTDEASSASPQGGTDLSPGADRDRLTRAQIRLSAGLRELRHLLERAKASKLEASAVSEADDQMRDGEAAPPSNWPVRGPVTSPFGWRVFGGRTSFHTGIDIAADYGTPVQATGDGVVVGSGWQPAYGWSVLIQHNGDYSTLFAHLSSTLVQVGDVVSIGDVIGLSGSSGRSTGPHLHYEIWQNGRPLDPRPFMDGNGGSR